MPRQFSQDTCVFCPAPSTPTGEHVLPSWLLTRLFPEGEYYSYENGEVRRTRAGVPRRLTSVLRCKLPMCAGHNGHLDRRFEHAVQNVVLDAFQRPDACQLSASDSLTLAHWFVKTWLLLCHPQATYSEAGFTFEAWTGVDEDLYSWIINGDEPPKTVSLWLMRSASDDDAMKDETFGLSLPTVVADGNEVKFRVKEFGLAPYQATLIYHPHWEIEHPLEASGQALRLWPLKPGAVFGFGKLSEVSQRVKWLRGPYLSFRANVYGHVQLPLLSTELYFDELMPELVQGAWMCE